MELIIFIIIIFFAIIKSSSNGAKANKTTPNVPRSGYQPTPNTSRTRQQPTPNAPSRGYEAVPNSPRRQKSAAEVKEEIWARLSEESKAKFVNKDMPQRSVAGSQQVSNAYASAGQMTLSQAEPKIELTAAEQVQKRRLENRNSSILERAKDNAAEREEDVTLNTMEAEHQHSERVAPAIHNHPEDVIPESMLGSISDLMVKGYDGNLCFERDFLGEGMDMISHFTVPSEVPDFPSVI